MAVARLTLPRAEARLLLGSPAASVRLPRQEARLALGSPAVSLSLPRQEARIVCRDVIAQTFTTPAVTHWQLLASDLGDDGAQLVFSNCTTSGSPCRVLWVIKYAATGEQYGTRYTSPEMNTPHAMSINVPDGAGRGLWYDLYWSWTSGNESGGPTLLAVGSVYVPGNGEGDFPAEG